ncbi:hypothetical protein AA0242T_1816 [Acetobacter aceti NRIC 0242]|uniref:Lipoprotein n=1 Tax=Acetobacter aceti NBRC 14818 TaxID=887700 RepID=A0AB33IBM2_ACEAC|nr:DUF3574 domain-containing protein [Acetobacter aceti]TCS33232.1 uncharacterized protein DUF3574 [Acetobacter aceti NBRC 14818]BCK75705.1 hypothetical protein EMQ_1311 [Acetobacter aceti NBRC 14818]GAN57884.1 hypothetical protein Abac_022_017 [Acetobacter aceti NBRC 14818]GBO81114.1 hypothetical protein AA0242T_1816 [Acetobacter aceti NRIC 0242]
MALARVAPFLLLGALLAGCSPALPSPLCHRLAASNDLHVTLMFGLTRPDGRSVTDADWQDFLRTDIVPRFPEGLSVLPAQGVWRDRSTDQVGSEPSRLVWIVTPDSTDLPGRIEAVRDAYKARFRQQSVGVSVERGCSGF